MVPGNCQTSSLHHSQSGVFEKSGGWAASEVSQCGRMETLAVLVSEPPLYVKDREAEQMEDVPAEATGGSGMEEVCQVLESVDEERSSLSNAIGHLLELAPHVDDAAAVVPPEPPDLSPGLAHKVNGAVVRRVSYPGAAGKHALRQQARRRRRNTSIAAGNSPPITRVTMKTVAATSPNPTSQSVQPFIASSPTAATTTPTTTTTTTTTVADAITTTATTIAITTTITTHAAPVSPTLSHISVKSPTTILASTPSPPMCRTGSRMSHSPSQFSSTRLNSKACSSSNLHPVLGTRVSSRIANNAATSGAHQHNSNSSVLMTISQSGAYSNTHCSGTQASRVVRVPVSQSSPSARDASSPSMTTMQTYLAAIPGFKPRKRSQRKLSASAQLAQTKEGNVDLETPDSILVGVNLRAILNKHTFASLPPAYQHRLIQLLPMVDQCVGPEDTLKIVPTGLNNEFFGRACESWRCRLGEGEFTHDNQVKLKVEAEKERTKLDPWKVAHFEPLWGVKQPWYGTDGGEGSVSSPSSPSGDTYPASLPDLSRASPVFTTSFTPAHIEQLTKVVQHIANRDQRRTERRAARKALRENKLIELDNCSLELKNSISFTPSSSPVHPCSSSILPCSPPPLSCSPTVLQHSSPPVFSCSSVLPSSSSLQPCTSSVLPTSLCIVPTSLTVTQSSLSLIPNRNNNLNTVASGNHTVFKVSDKCALSSSVMPIDPSGFMKDGGKRKDALQVPTTIPTKKLCVSSSDLPNFYVTKHGSITHPSQRLASHIGTHSDIPRSRVTITPVVRPILSGAKVLNSPVISQAKPGSCGKPAAMVVVNSSSQSTGGQLPASPASRTSPGMIVSPGLAPSPSRLSPVVQVVSPSLPLAPSPSPPVTRTVMVAGQARPVEVTSCTTTIGPGPRAFTQAVPSSSSMNVASKIKTVRTLNQGMPGSGTMTVKVTKSRTPGGVNIQRSYEIVQAVIANSPNRDQLQAQLKSPASLLAEVKPTISSPGVPTAVVVSNNNNISNNNSHLVVEAAPQLQTITVVKTVATSSSNSNIVTPVVGTQLLTGSSRTVRQLALSVGGTSTTMTHTQGGAAAAAAATTAGTVVLRQMVTPHLATSQVSASSASRTSSFLLDNTPFLACGDGAIRENNALTNIAEASVIVSGQSGLNNSGASCGGISSAGSDSNIMGNCGESFGLSSHSGDSGTTMVVVSQPASGTNSNSRVMVLHPGSGGPLLLSIPSESQPPRTQSLPLGPLSLPSTPISPSRVSPLGIGTSTNSQSTSDLTCVPTSAVCLSNSRPLVLQSDGCEGRMAPPAVSPRPITILRPTTAGKSIVVRMPVSSVQVVRLGSLANFNSDCGGNSGNGQQQQHPPRAASAPPNKSGVMVALSPRPSSVGPRIVVQTNGAQGSPATILTSAGRHFLSEGDPSSGVSSCDSDHLVTTRTGASRPSESSSDSSNITQNTDHPTIVNATNTSIQPTMNGMGSFGLSGAMSMSWNPSDVSHNVASSHTVSPQPQPHHQQSLTQPPLSQTPNLNMRTSMRMMINNMQHMNNMQQMNSMQPVNNMHQISGGAGINGMAAVMAPMNQGVNMMLPQGKSDTSEEGCPCNMKAMIICMKCGAFCHHDCIGPARLCVACLIR
ncbi:polycomb group protein Asx isoform X1 [Procambarus clarkii]|uniref:polycomb group protein Asx isoform X1 n=3 Tax=Procambarus clarkii TaxID=6728 RepID=UPI003742E4D0